MESPTFELTKILEWVQINDYKRIALQFPQNLLSIAPEILLELEKCANDKQFFILADTSYRSCCLDLIAAEHANCDSIVHFGGACMTDLNGKIPSLYIFENTNIDFDNFGENISKFINTKDEKEFDQILILCDSDYSDLENEIYQNVKSVFSIENIHLCRLLKDSFKHEENCRVILKREIPSNFCENKNNLLIFFGEKESPLLPLFVLTLKGINKILHYEPKEKSFYLESSKTNKLLMKRMYLAEKVKDANTIGLVLGYVSMECRKEAISRVRKLCKQRGKKLYVFYIGKLNEAKLTNFGAEIDVFVMLSCPYGILLDGNKFFKPIVSLMEVEMSLNQNTPYENIKWTGEASNILENKIQTFIKENDVDMSLTSGSVRSCGCNSTNREDENMQILEYSAGDYFKKRTWKGLDDKECLKDDKKNFSELKEGFSGIASKYEKELIN
uniref:2-(3-amino-3-carboxypropyl)histidine synthase subunit 2 n=1 Tax=Meloidogyne enterolobii TaxID=390850 RepID=A0A6V7WTA6_MELEN|nr:unnamed protein product [Meloidogyne enterolobii]